MHLQFVVPLILILGSTQTHLANSHQESGEWSCEPDLETRIHAEYKPGLVTLDGHADDWSDVDGLELSLLPALDPDEDHQYKGGKMTVKVCLDMGSSVLGHLFLHELHGFLRFSLF